MAYVGFAVKVLVAIHYSVLAARILEFEFPGYWSLQMG